MKSDPGTWTKIPNWCLEVLPDLPSRLGVALIFAARESNFGRGVTHKSLESYLGTAIRTTERVYSQLRQLKLITEEGKLVEDLPANFSGQLPDKVGGQHPSFLTGKPDRNGGKHPTGLAGKTPDADSQGQRKNDAEGSKEVKASLLANDWLNTKKGVFLQEIFFGKHAYLLAQNGEKWVRGHTLDQLRAAWDTARFAQQQGDHPGEGYKPIAYFSWVLDGDRPIAEQFLPEGMRPKPANISDQEYWYPVPVWGDFYEYRDGALEQMQGTDFDDPSQVCAALEAGWLRCKADTKGKLNALDSTEGRFVFVTPEEALQKGFTLNRVPAYLRGVA